MIYSKLTKSEFFTFFNLHEIDNQKTAPTLKTLKPGGFQEYIDIEFHLNKKGEIITAILFLDREWIGNIEIINPFGKDIAKSFIDAVVPVKEKEGEDNIIVLLIHFLFNMVGTQDKIIPCTKPLYFFENSSPEVKSFLDVYRNLKTSYELPLEDSILKIENFIQNNKPRIMIKWAIS
ncbi:MAG: hypothetical protein ACFE9T_04095 [Promethearchaeota archaeon]